MLIKTKVQAATPTFSGS